MHPRLPRPLRALPLVLALAAAPLPRALAAQASTAASHRAAVHRLFEVTRMRVMTEQTSEAIIQTQLQQMPQLAPYANVLRDFYREQTSWTSIEPEVTQLYVEVFTEPEIRELIAFYQTPLGQKMLTKLPALTTRANQITSARLQAAMPKLVERLQAAMQAGVAAGDSTRVAPSAVPPAPRAP